MDYIEAFIIAVRFRNPSILIGIDLSESESIYTTRFLINSEACSIISCINNVWLVLKFGVSVLSRKRQDVEVEALAKQIFSVKLKKEFF